MSLGSYALSKTTNIIVEVISCPYTKEDNEYVDVRFAFDPITTYTSNISDLKVLF
jgi:hypothetical protein